MRFLKFEKPEGLKAKHLQVKISSLGKRHTKLTKPSASSKIKLLFF